MNNNEQIRQLSNKVNIRKMIGSMCALVICLIEVLVRVLYFKVSWPKIILDVFVLVIAIIFLIVMVFSISDYWIVKSTNEALRKLPYGFDYQKELSTYKIIGSDSKKEKNGAQRFAKYSEWKEYLDDKYSEHKECDDFYRFLKRMLRGKKNSRDILTTVVLPIEIAALTVFYGADKTMGENEIIISLIIFTGFLILFFSVKILNVREEMDFLEDYIKVLYGNKKE